MPAGTKYNKKLNMDINSVKTPAFHDANLDEWLMAAANVVKTEGGLFVFQKGTDDGKAKVAAELTGSTLDLRGLAANRPAANAVAVGTTYWAVDVNIMYVSDGANWVVV